MFKILMDGSLIKRISELENENGKLKEEIIVTEANKINYADQKVKELREKMQKALTESDIERETLKAKLTAKLEVYEKLTFNFNLNKDIKREGEK